MITCHPKISIERRCSTILPGDIYHIWNIQNIWQGQNASSKQCIRYPDRVPELKTSKAILIFHLSLTDFLYCTLGLPFIVATLHYGYFPYVEGNFFKKCEIEISCRASASLCSYSALVRNLIAYADFLTMAALSPALALSCLSSSGALLGREPLLVLVFSFGCFLLLSLAQWSSALTYLVTVLGDSAGTLYGEDVTWQKLAISTTILPW